MASIFRRSASAMGSMVARRLQQQQRQRIMPTVARGTEQCRMRSNRKACRQSGVRSFSSGDDAVTITFIDPSGDEHLVEATIGKHLLDVAHDNNIELEGACGGELACSTCHLVFEQEVFDALPPVSGEEEDMLDLAMELTETSRLGCQICVTKELEGIKVTMPDDGY